MSNDTLSRSDKNTVTMTLDSVQNVTGAIAGSGANVRGFYTKTIDLNEGLRWLGSIDNKTLANRTSSFVKIDFFVLESPYWSAPLL